MIHVHPLTIGKLIKDEGLPQLRSIGTHQRFRRTEVLLWMASRKKTA
jgi:excisionase family DNA binding protein